MTFHDTVSPIVRNFATRHFGHVIDGREQQPGHEARLAIEDPATGLPFGSVARGTVQDVDQAVRSADAAFADRRWAGRTPAERAAVLARLADLIEAHGDELAQIETLDNGAPLGLTRWGFVAFAANVMRYYASVPAMLTGKQVPLSFPGQWHAYTCHEPVGVVGLIVPWNAPLVLTVAKVAPALAAGCSIVLKPSELTPLSALRLAELAGEAGLPAGVLNVVTGDGAAGAALVEHPLVRKISFTGSTAVGQGIARAAAGSLKRVSLELGGKSPAIVFADADLERAIPAIANAIFLNSGQVCAAASRLLVHRSVHDRLVAGIAAVAQGMTVGNGFAPETQLGPLISARQRDKVMDYIAAGQKAGADLVTGGAGHQAQGHFVRPTVFANTRPGMSIVAEEIFGPVLCVSAFEDEADLAGVAAAANASPYGLAASVWTRDVSRAHAMVGLLHAGQVTVNAHALLDMALPFGGWNMSGLGHEFGLEGALAYTELKSVGVRLD